MRVLSLEIENILSIEKASIKFDDNGLVLVEGWNYDTGRANGAGKTAIFNCLAFGLYDKLPRKITASEILRRGSKNGFVSCSVVCGENTWTVRRSRPKGVEFSKNGIKQDITQEEFEHFIRLSYTQFLLTIYIPQQNSGQSTRFLTTPDASKKEFILQLLNLDQFKGCKIEVDNIIKSKQALIDLETNKLNTSRSRIEAYEESLTDTASLEKSISDLQLSLVPLEKELKINLEVVKPDLSKYLKLEDDVKNKQTEISKAEVQRSYLHSSYRTAVSNVSGYDSTKQCSECDASLDSEDARTAHTKHQEKLKQTIADLKVQIDDCDSIIAKKQGVTDLSRKVRDKKNQESADYQAAQLRAGELRSSLNSKSMSIDNFKSKLKANLDLDIKIANLKQLINKNLEVIDSAKKELELYKTLSTIYSPTGAQAYVLDSVVDSFNEVIQKYIDIMSPDMSYTLNSFKETAKGDLVAKFSETLTKGGAEVSVGSLSGGEEKGLSLCVDFALLEVLETQFGMTLNPIILDEPFDGLDAAGREIVIDLLETLARNRQIFIIDHSSEAKSMFTKSIRIELRNEISTISSEL
jgi:DNA repair exonuclease SbcCD ATPase subunit